MQAIDCHCHIYPEKIAQKAVESVGNFYGIEMDHLDGTANGLLNASTSTPIEKHFVYSVATKPDQVETINNFIAQECSEHPEFIGFMTIHPDQKDFESEINRAQSLGLRGIKIHPDNQRVDMDDERLMEVYEIAQAKQIPMVIHTGDYRYQFSHPKKLRRILHAFPDLVVNAAHFGGWSIFDYAYELLQSERCFVDTSSAQAFLGPMRTKELCKLYGTDRVMFGSDFPMWSPKEEYEMFTSLDFTDDEFDQMLYTNALQFIGEK